MGNCKFCGQSNLDDAKFCANCGRELSDNCPNCGTELPGEVTFCPSCGTNLTTSQTQERRFVTVLFVDLVGFTADSDQADPEDVHSRLVPYHARVRREIEAFGGSASSPTNPVRRGEILALTVEAMMAEARGSSEALKLHQKAATSWEDYGFLLEQALNAIGRINVGFGDDSNAAAANERASRIFETLGVPSWVVDLGGTAERSAAL